MAVTAIVMIAFIFGVWYFISRIERDTASENVTVEKEENQSQESDDDNKEDNQSSIDESIEASGGQNSSKTNETDIVEEQRPSDTAGNQNTDISEKASDEKTEPVELPFVPYK